MPRRYLRVVLLGIAAFCVDMKSEMANPVGSKMCDRLCKHRVGCSSFKYTASDLLCNLTGVKDEQQKYTERRETDRMYANRNLTCQDEAVIFRTRANKLLCRSVYAGKEQSYKKPARKCLIKTDELQCGDICSQQRKKKEKKRLLMLPHHPNKPGSGDSQGRQLFLHNNSVVPCQYIYNESPTAVAYVSAARKLLIATLKPRHLFSVCLGQGDTSIIMRNNHILSITADEEMLYIFLVRKYPMEIGVMTIEGKNYRAVVNLPGACNSPAIAVDPKRTIIYVVCKTRLYEYTYKGGYRGWKVGNTNMRPSLYFDLKNDALYYMMGSSSITVYSLSLSTNRITRMKKIALRGETLYVIDDIIYVFDRNMKWTVVPEKGDVVSIDSGFDPLRVRRVVSCLIA